MTTNGNDTFLLQRAREAGITDTRELANFMGQMQVESGGFRSMTEGTRYSAPRLLEVFGPHVDRHGKWHDGRNGLTTLAEAQAVVSGGPEGIANAIYGGAWGARNLGNTEPGDGWRFRGRGYVQLTGRDHYEEMGRKLGIDLVGHPELAADREVAAKIAIEYWKDRVQSRGHQLDVTAATHDINGGENGLSQRREAAASWKNRFDHGYLDTLSVPGAPAGPQQPHAPAAVKPGPMGDGALTLGEQGREVRSLQLALGRLGYRGDSGRELAANGTFDAATLHAVQAFQHDHGLKDRGYFGPATQKALHEASRNLLTDPGHPQHALFEQLLEKVHAAERAKGHAPGPHSERVAAALVPEVLRSGIARVDHVEFNDRSSLVRAVAPGGVPVTPPIDVPQAAHQSVAISSREAHEVAVNLQAQRQDLQFTQLRPTPTPAVAH